MAGALAILVRNSLRTQFRRIDPTSARIVLVDMMTKVLGPFAEDLSAAAKQRLETLGVEVRLGHGVDRIDEEGVIVGGERIASRTVIWTAGVTPSPAGRWVNAPTDRAGRVRVQPDLTVPGHAEIFVAGDTASVDQDGKPLPGVAQVAMQQGHYAGRLIHARVTGRSSTSVPFRYFDKGIMAVVGAGYAVVQSGRLHMKGLLAWLAWATIHTLYLAQTGQRLSVCAQWAWTFLTGQRGARLIVNHHGPAPAPRSSEPAAKPVAEPAAEAARAR
jgi:NADH dehydrogenase FAD-containing subunit